MANAKYASTRAGKPYKAQDHYQELTDRVIAALEAGTRPWQKPWDPNKAGGPAMPVQWCDWTPLQRHQHPRPRHVPPRLH